MKRQRIEHSFLVQAASRGAVLWHASRIWRGGPLLLSTMGHIGFIGALVLSSRLPSKPPPTASRGEPLSIYIVAAPPPPAHPPTAQPDLPVGAVSTRGPASDPRRPPPLLAREEHPVPAPVLPERSAQPSQQSDAPAPFAPTGETPAVSPSDQSAPGASGAALAYEEKAWEAQILQRLEHKMRYPVRAQRAGAQDVIYVRITVDRMGRVLSAVIDQSKGISLLDTAALDLVRRSGPLPAPPSSLSDRELEFVVPLEYTLKRRN